VTPSVAYTPERRAEVERATAVLVEAARGLMPRAAFVLGSGLGAWADTLDEARTVPLSALPGVPRPTIEGHAGTIVFGRRGALPVVAMAGRVHLYEGHAPASVTLALEALLALGARVVVITNAAGAVNPLFAPGDLMAIHDQINQTGVSPFQSGWVVREPRVADRRRVYSPALLALAEDAARELRLPLRHGVYYASRGPSYETPAEVRLAARLGADAVGMSTVLEAAVASALGAEVLGVSCLTNRAAGLSATPLTHEEVMETAARARGAFLALLDAVVSRIAREVGDDREKRHSSSS
jgi:purine-nucleoside phosphorylase